uniref:GPI mannosyltransferase 2 n=1 Tax=Acrobeloides nanus TaxID=290746 RepID=A0A914CR12_9BILA
LKKSDDKLAFEEWNFLLIKKILNTLPYFLICVLIVELPLRIFSFVIEEKFCLTTANYQDPILLEYAQNKSHILPGNLENLTWCNPNRDPAILFPSFYEHVQEKYWGVGLFGYWEFRKIPLFIVAAPTIGFIFYGAFDFLFDMALDARRIEEIIVDRRSLIPYACHSLVICLAGLFYYNVECPMICWNLSYSHFFQFMLEFDHFTS